MKRKNWIGSISDAVGHPLALSQGVREELTRIDALLFEAWNLGGNIMLAWTREGRELRFLAVRHYKILEPFASDSSDSEAHADRQLINTALAGPKFIEPGVFQRLCLALGKAARVIHTRLEAREEPPTDMVSGLVTRYGVTLVRERAVILLDAVGFSLHSPLEQVAMLNSLSHSVNSACRQLASREFT
jgi:hypothetical protein